jgi:hypothetical protein
MAQYQLEFVPHTVGVVVVDLRKQDGYINATQMCKAAAKEFGHYNSNASTRAFLAALSSEIGIPISELVQSVSGGSPTLQGTWVHPQVAIHLAQWLSPSFAVQVTKWVYDWMVAGAKPAKAALPYHLRRYIANQKNVPAGHFSVLNEITLALIAPLEAEGYQMPEQLWPDISQGKMFAKWLRDEHNVDTNTMPTYAHTFEDFRPAVQAKAYPNAYLAGFRKHFTEVWLPQRAPEYFAQRDPLALKHLPKLLPPQK